METEEYSCSFHGHEYSIYKAVFPTHLSPMCITVYDTSGSFVQCFLYKLKSYISYARSPHSDLVHVNQAFLAFIGNNSIDQSVGFSKKESKTYKDTIVFSTHHYTFRAKIKEERYHYSVKIGGKEFMSCVDIIINKPDHPFYKHAKLAQVYSEPECWFQLGKKGNIVDLLKGSFQLCQMLFGVNTFSFEDKSNIECGITYSHLGLPRKLEKPLSLAYLSIAEKGKTWYERHFNAFISNPEIRRKYQDAITTMETMPKSKTDFEAFAAINNLRNDQYDYLKSIYESTDVWPHFFGSIPKDKQCTMLFNWLPSYMENHILHFSPTAYEWSVYVGSLGILDVEEVLVNSTLPEMIRTDMFLPMKETTIRQWGGRRTIRKRTSRKRKLHIISFSN